MKTIMLVEDDLSLGKALKDHFEKHNYTIIWATDASEAIVLLGTRLDLILLDIKLPGKINGFDLLGKIRSENSAQKDTPVVMLTNLGEMDSIEKATELGADDYIIKSNIDLASLLSFVEKKIGVSG